MRRGGWRNKKKQTNTHEEVRTKSGRVVDKKEKARSEEGMGMGLQDSSDSELWVVGSLGLSLV